jgi:hypothetical protein
LLADTYASADPRSLGLFRILFGLVLLGTIAGRWGDVPDHLSDGGWLPRAVAFEGSPAFSVFRWLGSVAATRAALFGGALVALCLTVGFWTRPMQLLAFAFVVSLDARNVVIENGGFVALIWLSLISAFLPLGQRFSLDALRATRARQRQSRPIVSLAVVALLLQWGAIYGFNYLHKDGSTWRDGSALHYFLHQEQAVTQLGVLLRERAPAFVLGGASDLARLLEAAIALLLLLPFSAGAARLVAWALALCLHLSIALVLDLGPFSWVMLAGFAALVRGSSWDAVSSRYPELARTLARYGGRASEHSTRDAGAASKARALGPLRELGVACVMAVQLLELSHDNRAVPRLFKLQERPQWLSATVGSFRLFQGWSLCAPDPPFEARRLVAVATRADGSVFDPLTGVAPRFEVVPGAKPRGQAWDEVHRRLGELPEHWPAFLRYLERRAERTATGGPLRSLELFWVWQRIPAPGRAPAPVERRSLLRSNR